MPANNVEQIKIWKSAHSWLQRLSNAYKDKGMSSASMTSLASQAILSIPLPIDGNAIKFEPCGEKEDQNQGGKNV